MNNKMLSSVQVIVLDASFFRPLVRGLRVCLSVRTTGAKFGEISTLEAFQVHVWNEAKLKVGSNRAK